MTPAPTKTLREARRDFERAYILSVLEASAWSVGQAARTLGVPRPNLYRKARQLSICLRPPKQESHS